MREKLKGRKESLVIGLMSGTSADGVDIALLSVESLRRFSLIAFAVYPYPPVLREILFRNMKEPDLDDVVYLNYALGEFYAECVNRFLQETNTDPEDVLLISSHGQTIRHLPQIKRMWKYDVRGTLQIGEISVIASRTGILTVGDFRPSHIAGGGEGAPLSPFFHRLFFYRDVSRLLVVNFGGIINITYFEKEYYDAFDVGPCNILIDGIVSRLYGKDYDREGKISMSGVPDEVVIRKVLSHPFYAKFPPKSTGREEFGEQFIEDFLKMCEGKSKECTVTSACEVCVRSVKDAVDRFIKKKPSKVVLCGGGARNRYIFKRMKELFPESQVSLSDEYGIPVDCVEAVGFALMGYCFLNGIPNDPEGVNVLGKAVYPSYPYWEEEL